MEEVYSLHIAFRKMNTVTVSTSSFRKCIHCGNSVSASLRSDFCCNGCKLIYELLNKRGLAQYYSLKAKTESLRKPLPAFDPISDYTYLDSPESLKIYSWSDTSDPSHRWMEFYLEGVHCAACVWLTEKVAEFVDDVRQIRLNLGTSIATVKVGTLGSFSEVAQEFLKMGYRPHPIQKGMTDLLQKKETRTLLVQLGVAGACAGNIMLLAISLYGGVEGDLAHHFKWVSFILFLPVITYSALPFYKSALNSLKSKQASIDIPIVFGILMGTVASIFNLAIGSNRIYFDSLSTLIFLLLATRYLLRRTQQLTLSTSHLAHFLVPATVRKWDPISEQIEDVLLDQIAPGDLIQVRAGESIPVDGEIIEGSSSINNALLTGESEPKIVHIREKVYAGTVNLYSPLVIKVSQSGLSTRLGKILKSIDEMLNRKSKIISYADRISRIFVLFVVGISITLLIWGTQGNWYEGINRSLALAIVTCPCTFALATPLAFSLSLGKLAKAGILVKGAETLEKLNEVRSIFFDKTGTLTKGTFQVIEWISQESPQDKMETEQAVYALEIHSNHPIAKAITDYFSLLSRPIHEEVVHFQENIGRGVSGTFRGNLYEIKRSNLQNSNTAVSVYKNHLKVGDFLLGDEIRPFANETIQNLRKLGLRPWILSGDTNSATLALADRLGISPMSCIGESSPEIKKEVLASHPFSIMVGDGANDAIALATAHVGVAMQSGIEVSMKAADIYLATPHISSLYHLVIISKETLKVVRRNFYFSLLYNGVAATAAVLGKIDPLFAALLMPMSAIIVFLSSISGTRKMRQSFQELSV